MTNIRRAQIDDLERVLPLVQAYRVFYKQQPDLERERAFVSARLREAAAAIYLAEIERTACGFVQLFKTHSTVHLANAWILEDLFVAPPHRGAGIASALLERAVRHAQDDGASGMFLETAHDNANAQRVYERAGWTRERHFYKYNAPLAR